MFAQILVHLLKIVPEMNVFVIQQTSALEENVGLVFVEIFVIAWGALGAAEYCFHMAR